uniref:Uncharacterized protein n=1 Tax=Heterorhabditis bacteriophora TaxID=37862 RepID=A0A1I7WRH9_HETBA
MDKYFKEMAWKFLYTASYKLNSTPYRLECDLSTSDNSSYFLWEKKWTYNGSEEFNASHITFIDRNNSLE